MEIFCVSCQKKVGKIADEKIPSGKKMSVSCPECSEKIYFIKPEDFSSELDIKEESASSEKAELPGDSGVEPESSSVSSPEDDFTVMGVIREAWAKTSGIKGPIWGAIALAFLAIITANIVVTSISSIIGGGSVVAALGVAVQFTISVAFYPFVAGLVLIGIRHSVGLSVDYKMVFSCFSCILPIIIASLLMSILSCLGFMLLVIPGIYLSVAYRMTIPLIVDREMGPWQAMEASRKGVHRHWFKVFGLYVLLSCIFFVSLIPLGLGLIWTVPMFFMADAILYREIFGVSQEI